MVQESPRESQFKERYFVSGRGISSGSGIAKRFKDPAPVYFTRLEPDPVEDEKKRAKVPQNREVELINKWKVN